MSTTSTIDAHLVAARKHLADAETAHGEAALKQHEHPSKKNAAELAQLEREVAERQRQIKSLEAAKRAHQKANSTAGKRQAQAQLKEQLARLKASEGEALAITQDFAQAMAKLTPILARWEALIQDRAADVVNVLHGSLPLDERANRLATAHQAVERFSSLSDGAITEALVRIVTASGLGRIGPRLEPWVSIADISEPATVRIELSKAIHDANERLLANLQTHIDARVKAEASDDVTA